MTHKEGDPPYIYIYIHSKFKERTKSWPYVSPRFLLEVLRNIIRVPKIFQYPILYQMEEHGLIQRISKKKYKILESPHEKILSNLRTYSFLD